MNAAEVLVCRTCTNQERRINMKSILTDHLVIHSFKMHMSIIEAFNEVTKMVVDENEPITTMICLNCVRRLRQAVVFRMNAAKSYEALTKKDLSSLATTMIEIKPDVKIETFDEDSYGYEENITATDQQEPEDTKPVMEIKIEDEKKHGRIKAHEYTPKPKLGKKGEIIRDTYYCAHCPATFTNKRNIFLHMKKLHMSKKPWRCWINGCEKLYVSPAKRRFHQEAIHYKIKRHVCDICGLCFTDNPKLQSHRRGKDSNQMLTALLPSLP